MSPISYLFNNNIQGFLLQILYLLPALVIAISFHEAAHAWAAYKMGDPTAKNLGRMTLDPTKHFDLWGIVAFLFIGFGWGKPVPTNPRNYDNYKKGNVAVALAGVTVNLILSFIFFFIYVLLVRVFGVTNSTILNIIYFIVRINLILCFFNLIPIPPLDGHHLVKGYIARKNQQFYFAYQRYGFMVLLGLLFLPRFLGVPNVVSIALNFLSDTVLSVYNAFFGLFF